MSRLAAFRVRAVAWAVAILVAIPASAQDRAVVFVHGLASSGSRWAATADRLGADLQVAATLPDLAWSTRYAEQARRLHGEPSVTNIGGRPIALGHSNGGVVSREWSKSRALDGIVTIGTPHQGAPLIPQFYNWVVFNQSTALLVDYALSAFARPSTFSWVISQVGWSLGWVGEYSLWTVVYLAASLGISVGLDVANEMRPGSAYLNALNEGGNLQREASAIPVRVGISSVAHNFYWAGPVRAFQPDLGDTAASIIYAVISAFAGWGGFIMLRAEPTDFDAIRQSESLFALAGHLASIDPFYCSLVSSTSGLACIANDGVVPVTSQEYPGAANIRLENGPAHLQEIDQADVLRDVLVHYLHIPPRTAPPAPPPPPPPPPPHDEPGGADGGEGAPSGSGPDGERLVAGQRLLPGQRLFSANGLYELAFQGDGNLVLYNEYGRPLWASDTPDSNPGYLEMQADGNFAMYDVDGVLLFDTWRDTGGAHGAYVVVQNDGNVVIYNSGGFPLWHTGTVQ